MVLNPKKGDKIIFEANKQDVKLMLDKLKVLDSFMSWNSFVSNNLLKMSFLLINFKILPLWAIKDIMETPSENKMVDALGVHMKKDVMNIINTLADDGK